MFRTIYDASERIFTNAGNPVKTVYKSRLNKNGDIEVYEAGKENIYKLIQSNADTVDINIMMAKFKAGDEEALNNKKAFYMDLTEMPESQFEAINMVNDSKWAFEELPVNIKEKFGNNYEKWLATAQTPEWFEKMEFKKDKVVAAPVIVDVQEVDKEEN